MKKLLIICLIVLSNFTFAQSSSKNKLEAMGKIGLGLHGIELDYDMPFSKKFSFDNSLGIGMGMNTYGNGA